MTDLYLMAREPLDTPASDITAPSPLPQAKLHPRSLHGTVVCAGVQGTHRLYMLLYDSLEVPGQPCTHTLGPEKNSQKMT